MGYKRKTQKKMAKKNYRRNQNYQGFVSGLPKTRRAYLRYNETVQLTSTLGLLDNYKFRANSIWDPNLTGTGHKPFGANTWASLYNHYVVVGSRLRAEVMIGGASYSSIIGCYISDDGSIPYNEPSGFIEAKKGTWKPLYSRKSNDITVKSAYNAKKFFNVTDVKDNLARLGSQVGTNPEDHAGGDGAYFNLWFSTVDLSTQVVMVNVTIDYIVEYSEPKDLAQS